MFCECDKLVVSRLFSLYNLSLYFFFNSNIFILFYYNSSLLNYYDYNIIVIIKV